MKFNKKEWTDRQVEYPNRRIITDDSGETSQVTIIRDEGEVIVPGDLLDAYNLNDLETRIGNAVDSKSTVSITPILISGTKIADITVDSQTVSIFAPNGGGGGGGGSTVAVQQILKTGTEIAKIVVDGLPTSLYAPTPTSPTPATSVVVTQTLTEGVEIGKIKVDNVTTTLYAPEGGSGSTDEVLDAIKDVCEVLSHDSYDPETEHYFVYYLDVEDNGDGSSAGSINSTTDCGRYVLLTTYTVSDSWMVYREDYSSEDPIILSQGSGIVTDKLLYLPEFHHMKVQFQNAAPAVLKMPGAGMLG